MAAHAGGGAHSAAVQAEDTAGAASRRAGALHHRRVRQDVDGEQGRDPARRGERGNGVRHAGPDAGNELRRHCAGHRRAHDPAAAGCGGRYHAFQFSCHGPFLVHALCPGHRELFHLLKPSERVPLSSYKIFHLLEAAGFSAGRGAIGEWGAQRDGECPS